MGTICKIDLDAFKDKPSPDELGEIVAGMMDNEQAEFFLCLGEQLRNKCGPRVAMQWQYIADAIKDLETELCDGSASQLIDELQQRLAPAIAQAKASEEGR